jgi:uncharacterized membrane protein
MCYAFLLQATLKWHNIICTITFYKYFLSHYHKYHHIFHHIWSMSNNKVVDNFATFFSQNQLKFIVRFLNVSYIKALFFSFFIWWGCVLLVEAIVRRLLAHHSTRDHFGCSSHFAPNEHEFLFLTNIVLNS